MSESYSARAKHIGQPIAAVDTGEPLAMPVDAVAQLLGLSKRSVWRLVAKGELPRPVRIGGSTRWDRAAVLEWWAGQHERAQGGTRN